jgi:hypothetical protein
VSEGPYKIFGVGLNKTATTSLTEAFEVPGLGPVASHGGEPANHEAVHAALAGDYQPTLEVARRFRAFEDRPWNVGTTYRARGTHSPDARFVLTLRQPERWWGALALCVKTWEA